MAGLQRFSLTAPSFLVNNCILIRGSENVQCSIIISPIFRGVIVNKPPACLHKNRKIIWKLKTSNISLMERQAWLMVQLSLCRNIRRFNKKLWAGNILPTDRRLCGGAGICRCGDTLWSAGDLGRWGPRHQPLHRARPRTPHSWEHLGPHASLNLWHHTLPFLIVGSKEWRINRRWAAGVST